MKYNSFAVEVNGYSSISCEGADGINNTTLAGAVVRSATVNVLPEGIIRSDTESAYFCANGKLTLRQNIPIPSPSLLL